MKTDARIRYTKMVIKQSFIALLKEKPVNRVTVKDVCERAEINRATFYKHYADCYDLLAKIEEEMIDELTALVQQTDDRQLSALFYQMFAKIQADGALYLTIASDHGDASLPARILQLFYEQAAPHVNSANPSPAQQHWLYYFLANGCAGVLSQWLNTGMQEKPEDMAVYLESLINKLLR